MTDHMADFCLIFSNLYVVIAGTILGYFLLSRVIFFQAAILGAFDIIVNVWLKGLFKVPLNPYLHKLGYAFPSGHMQFSVVFYLWLMLCLRWRMLRIAGIAILLGIAVAMQHFGYHNLDDEMGGAMVGLSLVVFWYYVLANHANIMHFLLVFISSSLMLANVFLYHVIPMHANIAYGILLSLIILERFCRRHDDFYRYWRMSYHPS